MFRDHPLYSAFLQGYGEYVRGEVVNSIVRFKMLVSIHDTSLANQHYYSMLLGRGGGM